MRCGTPGNAYSAGDAQAGMGGPAEMNVVLLELLSKILTV